MEEVWKDIEGWEGQYEISNLGRVKSLPKWKGTYMSKERLLTPTDNGRGYLVVNFRIKNYRKCYLVHRLVAQAFIDNPYNKEEVNHIDGDKTNNTVMNLEWVTKQENINHAWETGLIDLKRSGGTIAVDQFSEDGTYITTYFSMTEASKHTRAFANEISNCCNGKSIQSGGYRWRRSNGMKENIEPIIYPSNARRTYN